MRYLGSINKKSRRLNFSILENNKEFSKGKKRTTTPGQHGTNKRKLTNYGEQLIEKQKISFTYGISDRQLRRFFITAKNMEGQNNINLMRLIESRLDNLVFRMGFAPTRRAARQLVTHNHILLDNKKVNIPSLIVKINSTIAIKNNSKNLKLINDGIEVINKKPLPFVEVDFENKIGKYVRFPEMSELNPELNVAYVIDYYNKLM
jgi:small subunit ribosomal protein S4